MSDLYLVHGWRLDQGALKKVLADNKPEAHDAGLRVVFGTGTNAYVGEVLAIGKDGDAVSSRTPAPEDAERLMKGAQAFGLGALFGQPPIVWAVFG